MNRLFDNFFTSPLSLFGRGLTQAAPSAEPGFALYETADDLIAYVALPGMARDKFDISASADSITIKAEQAPLLESPEGLISHTPWSNWAIATGSFSTSYNLPVEIDPAKVQAEYKDGVLQVRMPKSEAAKPRQVKVEIANS
jgi:HSP20 family protein